MSFNTEFDQQYKAPSWFDSDSKRCECGVVNEVVFYHEGYSDCLFMMYRCIKCRKTWCKYVEG